ncbi:MAG: polyprenyl synthetase family protein [Candidatus Hodarchaeota archaeon]
MYEELFDELSEATKTVNQVIERMLDVSSRPLELYTASRHLIEAGGKRLRPFLVLKSCEIVGGNSADALPFAAAVEFIHNFTLIHDDIMDNDEKRRGVATVHNLWGVPIAITAGDLLFAKAYNAVLSSTKTSTVSSQRILKILEIITNTTISICQGQVRDVVFETKELIPEKDYFNMIGEKTAILLETSAKIGAIIGRGKARQIQRLGRFAYYSGLAFQIVDDILGLTADENTLGKPVGSDVREGKKTLIMIYALTHANETQRKQIYSVLGKEEASLNDVKAVLQIIRSLDALEYASIKAEKLVEKAKSQLSSFPSSHTKDILLNLASYILSRKY